MEQLATPIFGFLKRLGFQPKARPIDASGEPAVAKLETLLRSKQYERIDHILARLTPDRYSYVLYNLVRVEDAPKLFERWERKTASEHVLAVSGLAMIDQAWQILGGYYVRKVEDRVWDPFYKKLQEAERLLSKANRIAPRNPEPMGMMLISGIGLELEKNELQQRFDAVTAINPLHYRAHTNMLKSLKPRWNRWNRDEDEMFDFARKIAAILPDGDGLHTLVVLAHFEKYSQLSRRNEPGANDYFTTAEVKDEILDAYHRSLGSQHYIQNSFTDEQRNWFCAALHLAGARRETQHEIMRMRNRYTVYPWRTLTQSLWEQYDNGWVIDRVRREVGLAQHTTPAN